MTSRQSKRIATARHKSVRNARQRIILWVLGLVVGGAGLVASTRTLDAAIIFVMIPALALLAVSLAGFLIDLSRSFVRKTLPVESNDERRSYSQSRLMASFAFDSADLEANRHDYLAKSQRRRLYGKRWDEVRRYGIPVVVSLALYVGILVDGVQKGNISLAGVVLGTCTLVGISALLIIFIENWRRRVKADLYKGDLESIAGHAELIPGTPPLTLVRLLAGESRRLRLPTRLKIGEKEFETQPVGENVFVDGDYYRVYYVPHSMSIVSVDYLGRSPHSPKRS